VIMGIESPQGSKKGDSLLRPLMKNEIWVKKGSIEIIRFDRDSPA